ncbi:isopentenyl phosphate kinase-like [Dendrobium catenatum]|uniref:Isopentenyl phosphate kinase-like protein n=1 Tax=Dendrobium nobile TaxID=94219 RepID=A0A7T0FY33_DENNO|nr:isopentenyl phosphate kinase-like [Dendrobium catenatum]QPJ58159.1 isopentenyl phosphate kinase-like protein [Dendrobium nobile]
MEFHSESPISMEVPSSIQALAQHKHVRCIVKLGGAAITCKNELERINEESLVVVCSQLREAMNPETVESQGKVLGMDWSRRLGASIDSFADDFDVDSTLVSDSGFIIVHGAGSFGHFQASRTGVNKGGLHLPLVKAGFVATRISVTSLNLEIVRALARGNVLSLFLLQLDVAIWIC